MKIRKRMNGTRRTEAEIREGTPPLVVITLTDSPHGSPMNPEVPDVQDDDTQMDLSLGIQVMVQRIQENCLEELKELSDTIKNRPHPTANVTHYITIYNLHLQFTNYIYSP